MLPKVATNLLRAAVQTTTQTISPTFRTVLQHQSQASVQAGNATSTTLGWSAGAGASTAGSTSNAASAKYNAGGKFYNAYQAGQDINPFSPRQDDDDEKKKKQKFKSRVGALMRRTPNGPRSLRSSGVTHERRSSITASLVSSSTNPRGLVHPQLIHTSAFQNQQSGTSEAGREHDAAALVPSTSHVARRGYATEASANADGGSDSLNGDELHTFPRPDDSSTGLDVDPTSPQTVTPPNPRPRSRKFSSSQGQGGQSAVGKYLEDTMIRVQKIVRTPRTEANNRSQYRQLRNIVQELKQGRIRDHRIWSTILWAYLTLRKPGQDLREAIGIYNSLLSGTMITNVERVDGHQSINSPERLEKLNSQERKSIKQEMVDAAKAPINANLFENIGASWSDSQAMDMPEFDPAYESAADATNSAVIVPTENVVALLIRTLAIRDAEVHNTLRLLRKWENEFAPVNSVSKSDSSPQLSPNERTIAAGGIPYESAASTLQASEDVIGVDENLEELSETSENSAAYHAARVEGVGAGAVGEIGTAKRTLTATQAQQRKELEEENNFAPAMALISATLQQEYPFSLGVISYNILLQCALLRMNNPTLQASATPGDASGTNPILGGVPAAIQIFTHMERSGCRPNARTFALLLDIYSAARDLEGAQEVWNEFRAACARGSIDWLLKERSASPTPSSPESSLEESLDSSAANSSIPSPTGTTFVRNERWSEKAGPVDVNDPLSAPAVQNLVAVWTKMMQAHFVCGDAAGGLAILEKMMDSPHGHATTAVDVPPPSKNTYFAVVQCFVGLGDIQSALAWFKRLLEQPIIGEVGITEKQASRQSFERYSADLWTPIPYPPRPSRHLWDVMVKYMYEQEMVDEINDLFDFANAEIERMVHPILQQQVEEEKAEYLQRTKKEMPADSIRALKLHLGVSELHKWDTRDRFHWAAVWRANALLMDSPNTPEPKRRALLDWVRTRIIDHSLATIQTTPAPEDVTTEELTTDIYGYSAVSNVSLAPSDNEFINVQRRLTNLDGAGVRDRAWHSVGLYINQGRIDESIELATILFNLERKEIVAKEQELLAEEGENPPQTEQDAQGASTRYRPKQSFDREGIWTSDLPASQKAIHAYHALHSLVAGLNESLWTYGMQHKVYPSPNGLVAHLRLMNAAGVMPAVRSAWYIVNGFLSHEGSPELRAAFSLPSDWNNLAKTFATSCMSVFWDDNRPAPNPEMVWQIVRFLQILKENDKKLIEVGSHNVFRIYKILEYHLGEKGVKDLLETLGDGFENAPSAFPVSVKNSGVGRQAQKPTQTESNEAVVEQEDGANETEAAFSQKVLDIQDSIDEMRARFKAGQGVGWEKRPQANSDKLGTIDRSAHPLRVTPAQSVYVQESVNQSYGKGSGNPNFVDNTVTPTAAFERLLAGYRYGDVPPPENIARLIMSLGHHKDRERIVKCYQIGHEVLASIENNKSWQVGGWYALEDAMVTALAHCGDMQAAALHRSRLVSQGSAPSAGSYGALIANIKDTTDNAAVAIELFEESRRLGVEPNAYLYNTIISRLAKARKADYAMMLFQTMKNNGLQPTEVTYGAVIAGCARIGDAQTAETLFEEMRTLKGYRPRIPPFNTMMQLYTHVKFNKERALYYFDLMQEMGVAPSSYTYKLLLDVHGKIQPVDYKKMEEIIKVMQAKNLEISGNHYGALILTKGLSLGDVNGAIELFRSLRLTRPTGVSSMFPKRRGRPNDSYNKVQLPDVLAYEALFNVLVTNHRIDLMGQYFKEMIELDHVRPTAYIYNILIRGWASVGDIESARMVFETMLDPAAGAAAPDNHAPHMGNEGIQLVNGTIGGKPSDPVYREPSTWEAMVRAELSVGERTRATELLTRMKARFYPAAVTAKIQGILWEPELEVTSPRAPASPKSPSS